MANSSNPGVVIRSAQSDEAGAIFDLELSNPGGRDLVLTRIDYVASHGESALPVAEGAWIGELDLPARGWATLQLETVFDVPPLEPDSRLLHLAGDLEFVDRTGFMGIRSMDLTHTAFRGDVDAARRSP